MEYLLSICVHSSLAYRVNERNYKQGEGGGNLLGGPLKKAIRLASGFSGQDDFPRLESAAPPGFCLWHVTPFTHLITPSKLGE